MKSFEELREVSLKIFHALFLDQKTVILNGRTYKIYQTRSGLRNLTYEGIFFIEQNPNKDSRFAKLAQKGHQILWGLKGRRYILRVLDGEFVKL